MMRRESRATPTTHLLRADLMLDGARLLLEHQHHNSAVDRAFYAIFHAAVAVVLQQGGTLPTTHSGLRSIFGLLIVSTGRADRRYTTELANTFRLRQDSTYDANFLVDPAKANEVVTQADMFVTTMKRLVAGQ